MDNLTHSLVGLALSRAGLNRVVPRATLLLVLAANAPDADVVGLAGGTLRYFEWHRGYSHSLLLLPVMSLLAVGVTAAIARARLPWVLATLVAAIGVASHLLIDWTNNYGIRLLLPFSSRWFHLDINSLFDVLLLAVLLAAAVWPFFAGLVSSEIGAKDRDRGRNVARFALCFFLLYDGVRAVLHSRAVGQLEARLYDGEPPVIAAAIPDPYNPVRWSGAVESPRAAYFFPATTGGDLGAATPEIFYKIPLTPAIESARREEAFHFLQYFARLPVWSSEQADSSNGTATRVELSDLRFGKPNAGAFHAVAFVSADGKVLRSGFSFRPPDRQSR